MSHNPYAPPAATVAAALREPPIPPAIARRIRTGWMAAAASGVITLAFTLAAIGGHSLLGFSAWELCDVALIFGLGFGIWRRSRTCSVLMLVYFVLAKILLMREAGSVSGWPLALAFAYCYAQGVLGTFAYHKLLRQQRASGGAAG